MFNVNIGGTPSLSMVALPDIDSDTLYLSSDQKTVVMKDNREGGHIVYDLKGKDILIFTCHEESEIIENYPGLAVVFPSESVTVSLSMEIMGAAK